jgi:hypothetical protein
MARAIRDQAKMSDESKGMVLEYVIL